MQRFGSKVNNFWEPGYEPESDKTAFKPKDVDKEGFIDFVWKMYPKRIVEKLFHKSAKVRDPVTNSVLKLKKLVKVKFIPIDDSISDTKRQAAKARWKVRHLYSSQGSRMFYSVRYPEMF